MSRDEHLSDPTVIDGDIGPLKLRHIAGIIASEVVKVGVGTATATLWKSLFSLWYLAPLSLKLLALLFRVRREHIEPPQVKTGREGTHIPERISKENILCEVECVSGRFILINAPSELLLQFHRHYGHPCRAGRGVFRDRFREVA